MITFACKKIEQEDLIRCSFDINKTEYNVLMFMFRKKEQLSVSKIAELMNLERTTIQKAIKTLLKKNLVKRMQTNLPKGGYVFLYKINNHEKIKKKMKKTIFEWYQSVKIAIEKL